MIYLVDEKRLGDLTDFCENSPFGSKILSLCQCYGLAMPFLDFWLQYDGQERVRAALMKFENAVTIVGSAQTDTEEIAVFVRAIGFSALNTDIPIELENCTENKAIFMEYGGTNRQPPDRFEFQLSGSLYQAYDIMKSRENNTDFHVPLFEGFYVDMCHRMRHGGGECAIVFYEKKEAACALATAVTDKYVLLGVVACRPEYQNLGLGSAAVRAILSHFADKSVFVLRDENKNQNFYQKLGFIERQPIYIYKLKE